MIPIDDDDRALVLDALDDYCTTAEALIESGSVSYPGGVDENAMKERIRQISILHAKMEAGDLVTFDLRPVCMVTEKDVRCKGEGRYQPYMYVYVPSNKQPIAQLAVQPMLRLCGKHATNQLDHYLPRDAWRDIQAQVMRQLQGVIVRYDDCRVMYMDHGTKTMVEPPAVSLSLPTGGNGNG